MSAIAGTITASAVLVAALLAFWKLYFLRKPERKTGQGIVSPAHGKVIKIIPFGSAKNNPSIKKGLFGKIKILTEDVAKKGHIIVIMMTPFNVHYQRAPIKGEITDVKHTKGKFLNAVVGAGNLQASLENENAATMIKNKNLKVKIVQVAGFLARRIETYTKIGQKIRKGEVIGRINLGSQVILVLPNEAGKITVKEGQTVIDGETTIARG
jgi:phosphatidylserine decarboxylase